MIFLAVLMSFVLESSDMTLVACEAPWLDQPKLAKIVDAELSEIAPDDRAGMILLVDQCTEQSLRLRVSGRFGQLERVVRIEDIKDEARPRSIALALGELARESLAEVAASPEPPPETVREPAPVEPVGEDAPQPGSEVTAPCPAGKASPTEPRPEVRITPASNRAPRRRRFYAGAYLRGFAAPKTLAPEGRFGLRLGGWRFDLRGYAMGWKSRLGKVYLGAASLTAGPTLWRHDGKVCIGLDGLLELGGIGAWGEAKENATHTPKFNILAGGHLAAWLGLPTRSGLRPTLTIEGGWVRGLNAFAGDALQGGFEGPSLSAGLSGVW